MSLVTTAPCSDRTHSPTLAAGRWSCAQCAEVREVETVELAAATVTDDDWAIFAAAVHRVRRADGTVHACDLRPVLTGRIEPKRIASLYRRARTAGLLVEVGHERSNDERGRNAGRMEPYYELRSAAA